MLSPAPEHLFDAEGNPHFGTYQGTLPIVDLRALQHRLWQRMVKHKKWVWAFAATPELATLMAIVDVGYTSNAFVMAVDLKNGRTLYDSSALGPPRPLTSVSAEKDERFTARFRAPALRASVRGQSVECKAGWATLLARPGLECQWEATSIGAAPPLTVIAPVEGGVVNVTQKSSALPVSGRVEIAGQSYSLDGAVGGFDLTHGALARATRWRWAFAAGRLNDGTPIGFNLVEGFNEARDDVNENAVWIGQTLYPLGRARFRFDRSQPLASWYVSTVDGSLELTFEPVALHQEARDLMLVKSVYVQPVGRWRGVMTIEGRRYPIDGLPGVAEDQDVRW
jgi:hypothetical protein